MTEESIYNLIPQKQETEVKRERYHSKFSPSVPPTGSTFGPAATAQIGVTNLGGSHDFSSVSHKHKLDYASLGPKDSHFADPSAYLPKHVNDKTLPYPKKFVRHQLSPPKPAVVRKDDKPKLAQPSTKNFLISNAQSVMLAEPKRLPKKPNFLEKEDYGKVPDYLNQVKAQIESEKEQLRQLIQKEQDDDQKQQPKMKLLPEEERLQLLEKLKAKWDQVNSAYQGMTHNTLMDTHGKLRRKEKFERELQELEKSIEKLNKKYVYIHNDE